MSTRRSTGRRSTRSSKSSTRGPDSDAPTSMPARAWLATDVAPDPARSREPYRVQADAAVRHVDPEDLPEDPRPSGGLVELLGPIARRALAAGLSSPEPGFHVFVACEPQSGFEEELRRFAERFAATRPAAPDIAYVHDFERPEAPRPLVLPAGAGPVLVSAMEALVERLENELPEVTAGDEVRQAQTLLAREIDAKSREVIAGLETTAKTLGFGIRPVQGGVQTFPILHGKPLSSEQFGALDESTKRALAQAEERLTHEVEKAAQVVQDVSAKGEAARDEALGRVAAACVSAAMKDLRERLAPFALGPDAEAYFVRVEHALAADWHDFLDDAPHGEHRDEPQDREATDHDPEHATRLQRFRVNLLVSHEAGAAPPVVFETNPTYPNLFGYLERRARFGALLTDFTRIRPGSIHHASGGTLIIRVADLMSDPIIWERVKRVLRERRIGAEDPLGPLGLYATTLRPVPVPVNVRVVLVGSPALYMTLLEMDPDFSSLFRVKVEVEPTIPRTRESLVALDAYLMAMGRERGWARFDRPARAKLLDYAIRLAGDHDRVCLFVSALEETASFASAMAVARVAEAGVSASAKGSRKADRSQQQLVPRADRSKQTLLAAIPRDRSSTALGGRSRPAAERPHEAPVVTAEDVRTAWNDRRSRAGAAERHIREMTLRGEVSLDTEGARVGVVNGLSVYSAGDVEFGQPMRITAVVALGREGIIDVEREAQLGGSIHTKGVAIVRGYLSRLFGQERPLSLRAQIAFEQSYGEIDGDSASSAELFAVLSALAEVGIDQSIAVTGSVNQLGEVQTIGGVCAKIEGFFDLCVARGLTGSQGVLIPKANVRHLVLRGDVAEAIASGRFHLYAIANVSQGVEVLTGVAAGERDASGRFPAASVFGRVERRLIEIAERLREAEAPARGEGPEIVDDMSASDLGDAADFRGRL